MKYCPNCSAEFFGEVDSCSDCGLKLVSEEQLQRIQQAEEDYRKDVSEFMKVSGLENRFIADLVISALENEKIPYIIRTYEDTAYDGIFAMQKGWGALMIPQKYMTQASDIVEQIRKETESQISDDDDQENNSFSGEPEDQK